MSSKSAVANAVGGKTARACDSCVRKRARWYCAADDAFLCQSCDSSVHSANSLARRHHRLRLNSASSKPSPPSWHAGFTRKPRTPRPRPKPDPDPDSDHDYFLSLPLVPEADDTETTSPHDDHLLYCRVPTFDPPNKPAADNYSASLHGGLIGTLPSDLDDLEDFAADVETLLGRNLETDCFDMEGLGLLDCEDKLNGSSSSCRVVKVEEEEGSGCRVEQKLEEVAEVDIMRHHPFDFNFHGYHHSPPVKNELGQQQHRYVADESNPTTNDNEKKTKLRLRLDCDAVIAAWGSQKSPWTAGERPDSLPDDDTWPDNCMVSFFLSIRI